MNDSTGNRIRKGIKTFLDTPLGRYLIPLSLVVFLVGVPVVLYMLERRAPVSSWFDQGWEYRRDINIAVPAAQEFSISPAQCSALGRISIENSNSALQNYSVKMTIPYSAGMENDFSDLRFTNTAGTNLPHWIQTYSAGVSATVWVKVDSLVASGNTNIFMWFKGCTGGLSSNASTTFLFYDDFNSSLGGHWTASGQGTIATTGGYAYPSNFGSGGGWHGPIITANLSESVSASEGLALETSVWWQHGTDDMAWHHIGFNNNGTFAYYVAQFDVHGSTNYYSHQVLDHVGGRLYEAGNNINFGSWNKIEVYKTPGNLRSLTNGVQKYNGAMTNYAVNQIYLDYQRYQTYGIKTMRTDYLWVRKYVTSEPTAEITSWEEGGEFSNYDVLISVDTASLISQNKIQNDCDDIRFVDNDDTAPLDYWIESGCGTDDTQIWVNVPYIPSEGKNIYMYYGNGSAESGKMSWDGSFTLMSTSSCSAGWTRNTDLDGRFLYGSSSYGTTGGSSTHNHGQASCTTNSSALGGCRLGGGGLGSPTHTHANARVDVNDVDSRPPFLSMVMCESTNLVIPADSVAIFDDTVPSGWTRYSQMDNKFPVGDVSSGVTGGAETHSHTTTGGYATGTSGASAVCITTPKESDYTPNHTHNTSSGTTGSSNNIPPYMNVILGKADSEMQPAAGMITMVSELPPLGWTRVTDLDNRLPRGAASYGATGGGAAHTHSVTINTGGPSAGATGAGSGSNPGSRYNHTHSCNATTSSVSNYPSYLEVVFAKRKVSLMNAVLGEEVSNAPAAPTSTAGQALSTTSIRWNFVDNSTNEDGFRVYDTNDVLRATCVGENLSYCDEDGLSPNTSYTRKVVAYNGNGQSQYSQEVARYTLAPTPEVSTENLTTSSMDVVATGMANISSGSSGLMFGFYECTGEDCEAHSENPVTGLEEWTQTTSTTAGNLYPNTRYGFRVKARNGDGVETSYAQATAVSTLAQIPTLSIEDVSSSTVTLKAEQVKNLSSGQSGLYFECIDETCGEGLHEWTASQTDTATSLMLNTQYTFKVKARNAQGIETDFTEELSAYTGANIPSAPNVTQLSTSSLNVVIGENSNNSAVEYAVQEVGTEMFIDISTGELGAESWGTYAQWGGAQGVNVSELESGTQYAFRVKARNSDEVETGYGSSSSAWTALNSPIMGEPEVLSDTAIRWVFTDNEANETGFRVYNLSDEVVATCAAQDLGYCDETGLTPNTEYSRKIVVYNDGGQSEFSATGTTRTHASVPSIESVVASNVSAQIEIGTGNNPAQTEMAIQDELSGLYVDLANGGLVGEAVWASADQIEGDINSEITGLAANTQYSFRIKARNSDSVETTFSASSTFYTLANEPSTPVVEAVSSTELVITVVTNGNSAQTEYAILNVDTGGYVKSDGTLQEAEDWGTYEQFGLDNGITISSLTPNTAYEYRVKARNGGGIETPFSATSTRFTLANTPNEVVATTTSSTVANVSFGVNSNPSYTQFAIEEVSSGNWVNKGSGILQSEADWGTYEQFGSSLGIGVVSLSPNTAYEFRVVALNNDGVQTDSSDSDTVVTHANAPTAPEVSELSTTALHLVLNPSGNPADTQFVIEEVGSGQFVNILGQLVSTEVWATYSQFGGGTGRNITGLESGLSYEFRVKARNNEEVETGYSASSSQTTFLNTPEIGQAEVLSSTSIRWHFTDNESNEQGYRVYNQENVQVAQCVGADLTYCDEYGLTPNTSYTRKVVAYNSVAVSSASESVSAVTFANTPDAPAVNATSSTVLNVSFGANNNPAGTQFAVQEVVSGKYVNKSDGSLVAGEVWGTRDEFGGDSGVGVGSLFANAQYEFRVKARNSDNLATANSTTVAKYTLAVMASAPKVTASSSSQINLVVNTGGNPPMTEYAVREVDSGKYVNKASGALVDSADWGTQAQFGGVSGRNITGLQVNTSYTFVTISRNGDSAESTPSTSVQASTLANIPGRPTVDLVSFDSARITVSGNNNPAGTQIALVEVGSNQFVGTDGRLTSTATYQTLPASGVLTLDLAGLRPGSNNRLVAKARNSAAVETVVTPEASVYTRARPVNVSSAVAVSTNSIRLVIGAVDNDASVQYLIRETASGLYVDKASGVLQASESWGTLSEFGGSSGVVVSGLSPARDYSFRINARNGAGVITGLGAFSQTGTQAILTNIPAELKVLLRDNASLDLTRPSGGQRGLQNVRVLRGELLVADIPILFDANRDWSTVVIDSDPDTSRVAVKVGSEHGFNGKYTMYVAKGSTNAFVLCPDAHDLGAVSSDCTNSVLFIGPFPQTLQVNGSAVSVSIAILDGKEYWVIDGLSGTGGQGVIYEPGQPPVAPSPTPAQPSPSNPSIGSGGQGGSGTPNSGIGQVISQVPQVTNQVIQGVRETLDNTVGNLPERELQVVTTSTSVATVTVGVAAVSGGFTQIPYYLVQMVLGVLSFFGFRKTGKPYGYVYDSVTKKPVSRAVVRIYDASSKLVWTDVTDMFGAFNADLEPGKYKMLVRKPGYDYPSKIIVGRSDYPLEPVYKGELVQFSKKSSIKYVVPLDPKRTSRFAGISLAAKSRLLFLLKQLNIVIFLAGIALAVYTYNKFPTTQNLLILLVYIPAVVLILRSLLSASQSHGRVTQKGGKAVEGVIVALKELEFDRYLGKRVTGSDGEYQFMVPKGVYQLEILNDDWAVAKFEGGSGVVEVSEKSSSVVAKNIVVKRK